MEGMYETIGESTHSAFFLRITSIHGRNTQTKKKRPQLHPETEQTMHNSDQNKLVIKNLDVKKNDCQFSKTDEIGKYSSEIKFEKLLKLDEKIKLEK